MNYREVTGDLFSADESYTLVHCISADCAMGAGIAMQFRKRYPDMPTYCLAQNPSVGQAVLYRGNRHIVNLVTKKRHFHKPTYSAMDIALADLHRVMETERIAKLAMPLIGCGLDRLEWSAVSMQIAKRLGDLDIEVVVYRL